MAPSIRGFEGFGCGGPSRTCTFLEASLSSEKAFSAHVILCSCDWIYTGCYGSRSSKLGLRIFVGIGDLTDLQKNQELGSSQTAGTLGALADSRDFQESLDCLQAFLTKSHLYAQRFTVSPETPLALEA